MNTQLLDRVPRFASLLGLLGLIGIAGVFNPELSRFSAFSFLSFYRRLMPRRQLLCALFTLWPPPKDWFQVCRAWGVVISWATVFASPVGAASWWAIKFQWFHTLYAAVGFRHYSFFSLLFAIIGCIAGWKLFLKCEFHEQRHAS